MLQRQLSFLVALMVIVCSFLVALPALAESNVRIVRLSYIDGDAQINTSNQDDGFTHAVLNTPVTAGMWVYTPNGSHAEIQFENGSTVRLVDDAQVQFEKLALADSGGKIDIINVDHGVVYFDFDKVGKDDDITIKAAGKTFRVDKSSHLRVNANDAQVVVSVFKGETKLEGDKKAEIKSKETLTAASSGDEYKIYNTIDELGSDSWDKNRESEEVAVAAKSSPYSYPNGYNAQFAYLGAYGNYINVPGYGYGWQPFGVGMGWDPFMNGVWNYNPAFGYMWVSSYPWGWGPYRYGAWNYAPGYGWLWMPGSNFTSWNVGPRYGNVPSGWRAPVAPTTVGTKPARVVVVGNPPNVHRAIMAGHPVVDSHRVEMKQSLSSRPINAVPVVRATTTAQPVKQGGTTATGSHPTGAPTAHPASQPASHPTSTMSTSHPSSSMGGGTTTHTSGGQRTSGGSHPPK